MSSPGLASASAPPVSPPLPAAVLWDMDGTLLDTELVFKQVVFEVTEGLGFAMTDEVHGQMVGSSHEASNRMLVEAYGVSFPYELFDAECRRLMHGRMQQSVPVKPGVCIPWEQRVKEYPQILGDAAVVQRVWEQIDTLAYLYVWAHLIQW